MPMPRFRHTLRLKTFVILGSGSLLFTFLLLFIFSGELHHHDYQAKAVSGMKASPALSRRLERKNIETSGIMNVSGKNGSAKEDTGLFYKDKRPPMTVPRIQKYCNPPQSMGAGQEGLVPSEYKLLNVQVVIRHGDRSPIIRLPHDNGGDMSCLTDTSQFAHIPKVTTFVQVMASQLEKRPQQDFFYRWAMYPTHTTCTDGQLTGRGAVQHILNGIHFSERYTHRHQLFGDLDWSEKVRVHTTEVARTYQSAIAFMYGFLPYFDITKLNLKSSKNIRFCEWDIFGSACACAGVENLRTQSGRECQIEKNHNAVDQRYENVLSHIQSIFGLERKELPPPTTLLDGLSKYACHNMDPPCNSQGECATAKTVEALWEPVDFQSNCLHKNAKYKTYVRTLMHGLQYRIVREMKMSIDNKSSPTFHLYSGHDTTVSPLITSLELEDAVWPGYASRIVFELYEKSSTSEHFIRLLQNGKVVTSQAVFCRNNTEGGLCNFTHFHHYVMRQNLQKFCASIKLIEPSSLTI